MLRIYLDSNVFIAYIKSDMGKPYKLMYRDVEEFFRQCPQNYAIVLSDSAFEEIKKYAYYSEEAVMEFFKGLEIKTEVVAVGKNDARLTSELCKKGMHEADALHAALAINSKCDILLTFNKKHFRIVQNFIAVKEPNELME